MIIHINQLIAILNHAIKSNKLFVNVPFHRSLIDVLNIFFSNGFIYGYKFIKKKKKLLIQVKLKYFQNTNVFIKLKCISTNSDKIYWSHNQLSFYLNYNKNNSYILSTNKGILSHQEAIKKKVGGLVLCSYY